MGMRGRGRRGRMMRPHPLYGMMDAYNPYTRRG